ncbi:Eukaryotic translation initiation factor 4E type 2 [Boothiomyces macroporosus]|uniref:Eukaryotic translation initiation factor 4E type 2 n=1 Tax=Boothiomyces macroporosus TaxID=261099 RepID=A0AAD5UPC1_9FUNG|nr:Eukaryotic translation initiation factor 4E type 2 [Boothiomyces macroporosus]
MTEESEQQITIFQDPVNFTLKHPLQFKWTLWFDDAAFMKQNPKLTWDENLKCLFTVESVEDFWGLIHSLRPPSDLPASANYHLFKEGVKPMWEDKENAKGGKWTYSQARSKRGQELNGYWLKTMLAIIGEQFTHSEEITGAVISVRKTADRISLWTKTFDDKEKTLQIGNEFKEYLGITDKIGFQAHADTAVKNASQAKDRYSC